MSIDCVIGIDPGKMGAIAVFRPGKKVEVIKMPKELSNLKEWFTYMKSICEPIAFVEKLQLRPDDLTENPGKAFRVQKMLSDFERLKAIIEFCNVPYVLVHPQKWQNELNLKIKGEEKPQRKRRYKDVAAQYYPGIKVTMQNCDALLIMHFGRHVLVANPTWVRSNLPTRILMGFLGPK